MANTKLPARLLDTSAIPALNVTGDLTVDTTTLKVDSTNNRVGIGTSSPSSQLVVSASNGGKGIETQVTTHASNNQFILAYDRANSVYLNMELSALNFGIATNNGTNRFKILSNGNVGIGESNPANLLHVKVSDAGIAPHPSAQIVLERDGTNYLQFLTTAAGTSGLLFGDTNDIDVSKIYVDHNTTKMTFVNETSETMTLHGKHVGIGTNTPNQWASYTDSGATVLQVKSSGQRARIVAQGGDGAHLDLVDSGGASNDKHLNLSVDGGIGKFGSLSDTGGAWVQQSILTMDMGTGEVGIGGNLNLTDGKPIYSDTDSGTKLYTHLCTGSFYSGSNQGVAINTNIPSYNVTGNNMFAIYIKGYVYDNAGGGIIDCCIGTYSGEGAFHNNSYTAQNIPKQWQGKIRLAKNASDKLIILLGDTDTTTNYEIAVDCAVQGYVNVNTSYMENWTMSAFTSTSAYSGIITVKPKETQLIGFEAYNTGFTKTSGWHKISNSMSTESFDFGGYYDTSTGKFTPQVGGMYQFNVGGYATYSSSTGQERYAFAIAKNGSLNRIAGGNFCAGDSPLVSVTKNIYLNGTSDYVELWMYSAIGGSGITVGHSSHPMWWEGYLISPSRGDTTWTI